MSSLVDDTPPENGLKDTAYVVLVSERLQNNTEWSSVAQSLAQKHGATIYAYSDDLEEFLPVLKKTTPHLVALVAMPEEAGHDVVRRMNVMLRKIDDDPYADARWGLVTAASSKDAMKIVEVSEPLRVSSALSNTPIPRNQSSRLSQTSSCPTPRSSPRTRPTRRWPSPSLRNKNTGSKAAATFLSPRLFSSFVAGTQLWIVSLLSSRLGARRRSPSLVSRRNSSPFATHQNF